jgi:hypothetical protein
MSTVRTRALVGAAALLASLALATQAKAQATVQVPGVSGDQLIYFYDARTERVPFLTISNPAATPVVVEIAFYPADLSSRLGESVLTLPGAGNVVIDPTSSSVAGGAANGKAGLAVVTPIASATDSQPVVPPQPLTGGYTLANLSLGAAFGENPYARLAVGSNGARAAAGAEVDGNAVKYQRFTPPVLMVPAYFNPQDLAPANQDGNRVVVAAFNDSYGAEFNVTALSTEAAALFCDADGFEAAVGAAAVSGVLLSDLQSIAGSTVLSSSGKLFLDVDAGNGNVLGIFAQSLGTFAAGQRMPAVASIPDCPVRTSPTPTPTKTPVGTPIGGTSATCTGGRVSLTVNVTFDNLGGSRNIAGVTPAITYPAAVSIPGVNSDPTVTERVKNLTGVDGLFQVGDADASSTVSVGLVSLSASIPSGPFCKIQFDCTNGQTIDTSQFQCRPDVSDVDGQLVTDASCALSLSAP